MGSVSDAVTLESEKYVHRQTLANAVRFVTVELTETEQKITTARERALAIELELFADAQWGAFWRSKKTLVRCRACAWPSWMSMAALSHSWPRSTTIRARSIDDSLAFAIEGGGHPVVQSRPCCKDNEGPFIENDCVLEEGDHEALKRGRLWVLTGPNMAGKSTFLTPKRFGCRDGAGRAALCPPSKAHIGLVDRLFLTRWGLGRSGAWALDLYGGDGGNRRHS